MSDEQKSKNEDEKTWTEEVEIASNELVERVKELIEDGNVRRLIIRQADGRMLLEVPLTAGVVGAGAIALFAPVLAALGALAALVARVRIEIVRVDESGDE